ncbi:Putative inner membrane protein [Salmonella enterica subsp. enterica]|uniref:Inner membrane protein n=1 Tax=Salmonella enterica I TaxID=59201 RepID=A0A379WYF5_SALET|nr:Putative inner membrane protein [Salmonella enterica subsp. enterica]
MQPGFATLAVMLQSETLVGSVWLLVVLFIAFNGFFFFDIAPRYHYNDIDVLDLRVCYNGEWYNTRFVPPTLIETILQSPQVDNEHKVQLQKMVARKGELSFYDIFTLARAEARPVIKKCAPSLVRTAFPELLVF